MAKVKIDESALRDLLDEVAVLRERVSLLEQRVNANDKVTITWSSPVVTSMTANELGREIAKSATRER